MKRAAVAALAFVLALAAAVAFVAQRVQRIDPLPGRCGPAARACDHDFGKLGPLGRYDVALSGDGCLRARLSVRFRAKRAFEVYELQSDGAERALVSGTQRADSELWGYPCPPQVLPELPKYWWPTELTSLTWHGYSDAGTEVERVERRIEGRGRVFHETRFVLEGGRWVEGPRQTLELDLAPDRPPKLDERNRDY